MEITSKWIAALMMLFALALAGCSGEASNKKVIGISLQNFTDEFRTYTIEAMEEEQKKHPDIEFIYADAQNDSATQKSDIENWLQSSEQIDAVIANNDEMAIGAMMALEAEGKLKDTVVAGIDATPAALDMMKEGKLKVTVFQDAFGQGKGSSDTAVKAANGEKVEDLMIPFQLVTPENMDEFVDKYE